MKRSPYKILGQGGGPLSEEIAARQKAPFLFEYVGIRQRLAALFGQKHRIKLLSRSGRIDQSDFQVRGRTTAHPIRVVDIALVWSFESVNYFTPECFKNRAAFSRAFKNKVKAARIVTKRTIGNARDHKHAQQVLDSLIEGKIVTDPKFEKRVASTLGEGLKSFSDGAIQLNLSDEFIADLIPAAQAR